LSVTKQYVENLQIDLIAISGPDSVGKTMFAAELAKRLGSAAIVENDHYLYERRIREARKITGYNPAAYDLQTARRDLLSLRAGCEITVRPYDKKSGEKAPPEFIKPADILIVEGAMALHEELLDFAGLKIFLDAAPGVVERNHLRRGHELGFTPEQLSRIERRLILMEEDYQRYIAPQRDRADVIIQVADAGDFLTVELRRATFRTIQKLSIGDGHVSLTWVPKAG
jgi:uridine kinase